MSGPVFEGLLVPLLLPLDEDEKVIESDLVNHVRYLVDRGVNGFLVPSGTGEFYNLTDDERRRSVEIVVGEVAGRLPVISLAGDCGTLNSLRHVSAAREAGADGVMATPPYFEPIDQKSLKAFFFSLADEGGLPLWLYHHPASTKLEIEPATVRELAENPNVVAIKASAWVDVFYFQRLLYELHDKPDFCILMGEDINEVSGLLLGGHGMVSTVSNLIPEVMLDLWDAIQKRDIDRARALQHRATETEMLVVRECDGWQAAAKYVLVKRGIFSTTRVSNPLPQLSSADRSRIDTKGRALWLS